MSIASLPRWKGGSGMPVTVDATGSITAHARSLTVLFDSFSVTPPSRSGQSTTHTAAFRATIDVAKPVHLLVRQQLRGRVVKGAESRVVLTSMLGPSVLVHEIPYGQPFDAGILIEHEDDFVHAPRQPCTGIITVLIEQRESDTAVLVAIDGIDATLVVPGGG